MRRIILVEGIPGSGKSTLARFLANQFERNGHPCSLFLETTYEHPIIVSETVVNYQLFIDSYIENWRKFLAIQYEDDSVVVMESALFQNPIVHLLHKDIDREVIKSLIFRISELLSTENCSLIYLYQQDSAAAILKMIDSRGREEFLIHKHNEYKEENYFVNRIEQGPEAHITFFNEYADMANDIVNYVSMNSTKIENSNGNFQQYEMQVLDTYGLRYSPDPVIDTHVLQEYAGTYHNEEMNFSIQIELNHDCLMIFGNKRLKPHNSERFYLDDMSVVVSFSQNGEANRLIITEKDLYANRNESGTVFNRIS